MLALACSSCATYTDRTQSALAAFETGRFEQAESSFANPKTTGAPFLRGVESGTVALTAGRWDQARAFFDEAYQIVRDIEDRALVSAEELGETLMSFVLNDTVKEYPGEGYERVMLHACLAMTFLAQGRIEGVYVEARRANKLLEAEEKLYKKRYQAGGLGHFISALAYELVGEPGEAYIDFRRMEEKDIGGELVGKALVRLARQLGRTDDLARWTKKYGDVDPVPPDSACIVVLAGVGLGPYKREIRITLPAPDGVIQWAVPTFVARPQPVSALRLTVGGSSDSVRTTVLENVARVAKENLDDRIAWLGAKSAVRATLKYALTKELRDNQGTAGLIAGIAFTLLTERADLRCWLTLPDTWQASRTFLPAGTHALALTAEGGERVELGTFTLEPGETLFVLARTLGTRVYPHVIGGRSPAAASLPEEVQAATPTP